MQIYKIDERINEILNSVDEDTGEFTGDLEELEALQMERAEKIEHCLLAGKNALSEAEAIAAEIKALTARKKTLMSSAERAFSFAKEKLNGESFETARVKVSYSKAVSTEVDNDFVDWALEKGLDDLLSYSKPTPNKKAIKEAINDGVEVMHAWLTSGKMQVK